MRRQYLSVAATAILLVVVAAAPMVRSQVFDSYRFDPNAKYGGTFILGVGDDPTTLNPCLTSSMNTHYFSGALFNSLLDIDADMNIGPNLAEFWEVSSDGLTYTFHLVRNATWHDGAKFTSADVKFTVEEIWQKYAPYGPSVFAWIDSLETPDDYTVILHMKAPFAPMEIYLSNTNYAAILPKHIYENTNITENPHNLDNPIGTGPFMWKEWVKGDHLTFVKNPNYFKKGLPYLDQLIIRIIPSTTSRATAIEQGEIHAIPIMAYFYVEKWALNPDLLVSMKSRAALANIMFVACNMRHPIVGGLGERAITVRQALYHTIDKELIRQRVIYNVFPVASSPFTSSLTMAYKNMSAIKPYDYDIEKANQMLDGAEYPRGSDGIRFELTCPYESTSPYTAKFLEIWREDLEKVGVKLNLIPLDRSSELAAKANWDFDICVEIPYLGPDPSVSAARFYISSNIKHASYTNVWGYNNSEVDRLFELAQTTVDYNTRKSYFDQIQDILWEQVPCLWVVESAGFRTYRTEFKGMPTTPLGPPETYETFWWIYGTSPTATATVTATTVVTTAPTTVVTTAPTTVVTTAPTTVVTTAAPPPGLADYWVYVVIIVVVVIVAAVAVLYSRTRRQ